MMSISHAASEVPGQPIRVLIVDDHAIVREALMMLLISHSDIAVVGQAPDGIAAIEQTLRLKPDLVLMDINMPKLNGIEATRQIVSAWPEVRVVGLSMQLADIGGKAMMEAGAVGYISKSDATETLVPMIRRFGRNGEGESDSGRVRRAG